MNKTININLGGFFFHIDETAFQKLKRYLDAIARSLSDDPQGKNEIIADIEARISELLSEKITDARQVVNENDIDEIIAIMGQPEDYAEAEEGYTETSSYQRKKSAPKKLFRDGDDKFLGGVCAGLGHYLGIDTIWIRLVFLILTLAGVGLGIVAYIILWILLPEAKTTSEKLQMEGEPVNINNIEKKIRDEFEMLSTKLKNGANDISDKISGADYEKLRNQTKSGFQDFLDTIGKILGVFFKIFGKFLGVILIIIAGVSLLSIFLGLFSIGSLEFLNFDYNVANYPSFLYASILPKWLLTTFFILLIAIPFIALFILGLRILSPNIKRLGTASTLTLSGIWLVSLLGIGFASIEYTTSRAHNGIKVVKQTITFNENNPLKIGVENNNDIHYQYNLGRKDNSIEVVVNDEKMKYSNNVRISVKKSEKNDAYVEVLKESEGRKRTKAVENADKIDYKFKINDNKITFNAFFLSEYKNIWKDEKVRIIIYIPKETIVYFEGSSKRFLNNIDNVDNMPYSKIINHHFKMTSTGLECTDCKEEDFSEDYFNETNDNDVTFLFDSTINDKKAELIINRNTTKKELEKLVSWFKNKKNIDIDFSGSRFHKNGKLKQYVLKINCNDGYKGNTKSEGISINSGKHGFVRSYNEDGTSAFKIW